MSVACSDFFQINFPNLVDLHIIFPWPQVQKGRKVPEIIIIMIIIKIISSDKLYLKLCITWRNKKKMIILSLKC